jgi:hypothetical protein
MSEAKALSERIAAACPCAAIALEPNPPRWRGKGSCLSPGHCPCAYPEYRELNTRCLWPGHALAAEVAELERDVKAAARILSEYKTGNQIWMQRAESAERLLAEAPEIATAPLSVVLDAPQEIGEWFAKRYRPWLARVRAAGRKP